MADYQQIQAEENQRLAALAAKQAAAYEELMAGGLAEPGNPGFDRERALELFWARHRDRGVLGILG